MITADQLVEIGHFNQPHGIKGELNAYVPDVDAEALGALRCIVVDVDGIFVPFFIASVRQRNHSSVLIQLDDIDSDTSASQFAGKAIYALADELPDEESLDDDDIEEDDEEDDGDGFYAEDFIGWTVSDVNDASLQGEITDIDDSTDNVLFVVTNRPDGKRLLIPVADDLIDEIDVDSKHITFSLPQGLLSLQ